MTATVIATPRVRLRATPLGDLLAGLDPDDLARLAEQLAPHLPQPEPDGDRWLTTSETADYLGISLRTLYRRMDASEIEFTRDGGRCLFRRSALDAYRGTS